MPEKKPTFPSANRATYETNLPPRQPRNPRNQPSPVPTAQPTKPTFPRADNLSSPIHRLPQKHTLRQSQKTKR